MPKVRRLIVGKRLVVNLGDYNNVQPNIEIEGELDEGETYQEARRYLMGLVDEHLAEEIDKHSEED